MIRNLLSNAVRHARSGVSVDLTQQRQTVVLIISDDGPGVAVESREQIFERFGRADGARSRPAGGAGLGLAIVRDIVERHGGTIDYDETVTDGARFVAELPGLTAEDR